MRWEAQTLDAPDDAALPGFAKLHGLVRSVTTPEFAGITFHEVMAKSALNSVPAGGPMPFSWTVNPYRGCSHACVYCFARPSHQYLDLDSGRDFDSQLIVKINVAEQLRRELARPAWAGEPVALGTNTDPYQRAEGRYKLMPGIISALADSGTPFSILTKGTLLRRDLPLLADAAARVPIQLAMSVAVFDDDLQQAVEPGTPSTEARLATVRAATEAGFDVAVFMMPILPFLTDSSEQLDAALTRIKAAGATSVTYSAMHLRPGVKEWFAQWLYGYRPELVPRYRALYRDDSYAPKSYRRSLAERIKPLIAAHGLARAEVQDGTGASGVAPGAIDRATARDANGEYRARRDAASGTTLPRVEVPTLF